MTVLAAAFIHPLLAASVEVFVLVRMNRDDVAILVEGLRSVLHAVETYPVSNGYWCRLLGPHRLLDAIMLLPSLAQSSALSMWYGRCKAATLAPSQTGHR